MATIKFLMIIFYLYKFTIVSPSTNSLSPSSSPKFSALFVFGDSTVDTGNNMHIPTFLKPNYLPYGQNYTTHLPTGRFSNGKLVPDMLASYLGIKESLPPFLDPTLSLGDLITGVNFASSGSGLDDLTSLYSLSIPVSKQIQHFKRYINKLKLAIGEETVNAIVNSSLVYISAGANDWLLNYYDIPTRRLTYDVNDYQDFLLGRIQYFIKELYEVGCHSIIVNGLPPIGSLPFQITWSIDKLFGVDQNKDTQVYNQNLIKMLHELESTLPGIQLVYADYYTPIIDMIKYPKNYGFIETTKGCCVERDSEFLSMCSRKLAPCENPDQYLFWDGVHPTLATYTHIFNYIISDVIPQFSKNHTYDVNGGGI
ncbi:GDSL esterase/lipase At2g30310-like [Euphorbia lathyris]|uniref:GDSL esterase/lipase At2g30310-like n=1 Tax=Euphorbia lathyris TaxID=212925 RepID=UPI003313E788